MRKRHKMIKNAIKRFVLLRQLLGHLSVFDHFVGLTLNGLML